MFSYVEALHIKTKKIESIELILKIGTMFIKCFQLCFLVYFNILSKPRVRFSEVHIITQTIKSSVEPFEAHNIKFLEGPFNTQNLVFRKTFQNTKYKVFRRTIQHTDYKVFRRTI